MCWNFSCDWSACDWSISVFKQLLESCYSLHCEYISCVHKLALFIIINTWRCSQNIAVAWAVRTFLQSFSSITRVVKIISHFCFQLKVTWSHWRWNSLIDRSYVEILIQNLEFFVSHLGLSLLLGVKGVFRCAESRDWESWWKLAWNKHGYLNVTGSSVQKIGRAQADFFREVTSTNQY